MNTGQALEALLLGKYLSTFKGATKAISGLNSKSPLTMGKFKDSENV
jgi:hypothetical protein